MPLNKLDNFIKNTEGRILYVNPSDLDSSDAIDNQGNSLARPFKTIQRALIEAARFSYVRGNDNDITEKTTILLFPGEHVIDNRPGWAIYNNNGAAYAVPRTGGNGVPAQGVLSLGLDSIFDLNQEDNILYKFNSFYGGVIVPRGTSLVGLDLRKTKIRPKYVPNPTDPAVPSASIFRITGACYFWQFSFFDGDETGTVYTNPTFFDEEFTSVPLFSHHKLRCFEYVDGVNKVSPYALTDLDMYYSKLSNAYNNVREILDKFPADPLGFSKRTPEWEIVGAFQSDPIEISSILSGNGTTASSTITVTTEIEHNLNAGTPIKIRGVSEQTYNVSTKVQTVIDSTTFTYLLPSFPANLNANPSASGSTVTIETDTVTGASPYIFNCSLRSVWGMNGMYANGSKASGFKSMVVAQFTGVSLQKDDRAFVKYDPVSRTYNGVDIEIAYGSALPAGASQTSPSLIYHLDPDAIYRPGWETSHVKISDDAFIQVVSVFAIGFNKHFDAESGGDYSITNSNSNFGQISLNSSGFRKFAFDKDNTAYVTSIISPRALESTEEDIQWLSIDVGLTTSVGITSHLYLYGYTYETSSLPSSLTQGYRIGAKTDDELYIDLSGVDYSAKIYMHGTSISGSKVYSISGEPTSNVFTTSIAHSLETGESVLLSSDIGDLPENIQAHTLYYVIKVNSTQFKLASSVSNALLGQEITVYKGSQLKVWSRVSDKESGDPGSPIQWDSTNNNWYVYVDPSNEIYTALQTNGVAVFGETTDLSFIKRIADERSIDEKLYKLRVVIPKEAANSKNPEGGFIIQESSSTRARSTADFTRSIITSDDYDFNRNPRFITTCSAAANVVTVISELPHDLKVGDIVIVNNVYDSVNTTAEPDQGYNGQFTVASVPDELTFTYSTTDIFGTGHVTGSFANNINNRTLSSIPYFTRNNLQSNLYIYRNEIISEYIEGIQDGIYHFYVLNASNAITDTFTTLEYSQSPVDLYPQLDRDNLDYNPPSAKTFAKRSPLGEIVTNDRKKSLTRETVDKFNKAFGIGLDISSATNISGVSTVTFSRNHTLGGVVTGTIGGSGGSGYSNGTYYNVKLFSNSILTQWNGVTANVTVAAGKVTTVSIVSGGSGYSSGTLYFDTSRIGNGTGATFVITTAGISTSIGDVVQFTGAGTTSDCYHRITSIPSKTSIAVGRTSGDPLITTNHYAFIVGQSVGVKGTSYDAVTGITTFSCGTASQNIAHGLIEGNQFRIIDSSNNNLGDFIVQEKLDYYRFTAVTNKSVSSGGYVLKHGLSGNNAISDQSGENLGTRGIYLYGRENLRLETAITTETTLTISCPAGIGTSKRFELGDYIQVDNEIMRISSTNNDTTINVLRGVLGTRQESHQQFSLIRKIEPVAVEFRRPSIVRASGHTFEYLGYGPGNYSTSLPQVQVRTLSDAESFLSQAQERSGGSVVYTGMNNSGDVFSGNTKTSASSGETISFDIPTPTITGQQESGLSAVFDEVTIKEKLLVEGGDSGTVLSQFDGPVTFNKDIRTKGNVTFGNNSVIRLNNTGTNIISKGSATFAGSITVDQKITSTGIITSSSNIFTSNNLVNGGFDFILGNKDQVSRGNSGLSRALVKDSGNVLSLNYNKDFANGTKVYGELRSTESIYTDQNLNVTGIITAGYLDVPNITPIGGIVIWSGTVTNFPSGWAVCNGQALNTYTYRQLHSVLSNIYGGTAYVAGVTDQVGAATTFAIPNLTDRFLVGSAANSGTTITGGTTRSGGTKDATLVTHTHAVNTAESGFHSHVIDGVGDHAHNYQPSYGFQFLTSFTPQSWTVDPGRTSNRRTDQGTGGAGAHSHNAQGNGSHTHVMNVSTEGSSATDANLPPYYALFYIMRII